MFTPPRPKRGACTRTPRLWSAVTIGAVTLGATLGLVPGTSSADPATAERTLFIDIVGDSYMAGDGTDNYLDPADPRHRSLVSPALQALSRVAGENPGLRVDANVVASSGAVTADYFTPQKVADAVVNTAQHDQIRPNAQVVLVGFGGSDAELAQVLAIAKPSNSSTPGDLAAKVKNHGGLLDTSASDQAYLDQASATPPGTAPTLVSRLLQVLGGIANRAPNARIIVTNYPVSVDPANPHSVALIKEHDLVTVQKFVLDLNYTIERAVAICSCADLVDLTEALDGHEAYTEESAYGEPAADEPHPTAVGPNDRGAALMADPLATNLAATLGIRSPQPSRGKVTVPTNIAARSGVPDVDGDLVPDQDDESPRDRHNHRRKHGQPLVVIDLGDRDGRKSRPDGRLPVRILPPAAPHRESGPRPENPRRAEPDAGERRPAPPTRPSTRHSGGPVVAAPPLPVDLARVTEWARGQGNPDAAPKAPTPGGFGRETESDDSAVEVPDATDWRSVPDSFADVGWRDRPADDEALEEPDGIDVAPKAPADPDVDDATEDSGFGVARRAPAEQEDHESQSGADGESAGGFDVEPKVPAEEDAPRAPVTERSWVEVGGDVEESPSGDVREPDGLPAEPAPEPAPEAAGEWRQVPPKDVSPVMPVTEVPQVGVPWRPEPVEEPVVEAVPKEQPGNGEQVCILIYPAPEGCGS